MIVHAGIPVVLLKIPFSYSFFLGNSERAAVQSHAPIVRPDGSPTPQGYAGLVCCSGSPTPQGWIQHTTMYSRNSFVAVSLHRKGLHAVVALLFVLIVTLHTYYYNSFMCMCGHRPATCACVCTLSPCAVALFVAYLYPPSAPVRLLSLAVRPVASFSSHPFSCVGNSNMSKVVPSECSHHYSRLALHYTSCVGVLALAPAYGLCVQVCL